MTTAGHGSGGARGAAPRWTRAVLIALVAALAVLVHHETAPAATHPPHGGDMAGMHHTVTATTPLHAGGHVVPSGVTPPTAAHDDGGACSGTAHHCSAAGLDSVKLAPPQAFNRCGPVPPSEAAAGRDVPGSTGRAPPDLSALSRFLL